MIEVKKLPIIRSDECEKDAIMQVSKFMLVSARTAPKTGGVDDLITAIISYSEKDSLANEMEKMAEERKIDGFKRDAKNVRDSETVVLVGVRGTRKHGLNCGACGFTFCEEFEKSEKKVGLDFVGATCLFKALDLGIALGSAVKMAGNLNVDNCIMYRIGTAAMRLKMLPDASVIMGVPLSTRGKNPYFDRR
ncbi:MAG: hypothetical protein QG670_246 [Thermoproteota archaeon]|nr:hypothetical protein [Thermoproteota archaeon]